MIPTNRIAEYDPSKTDLANAIDAARRDMAWIELVYEWEKNTVSKRALREQANNAAELLSKHKVPVTRWSCF